MPKHPQMVPNSSQKRSTIKCFIMFSTMITVGHHRSAASIIFADHHRSSSSTSTNPPHPSSLRIIDRRSSQIMNGQKLQQRQSIYIYIYTKMYINHYINALLGMFLHIKNMPKTYQNHARSSQNHPRISGRWYKDVENFPKNIDWKIYINPCSSL